MPCARDPWQADWGRRDGSLHGGVVPRDRVPREVRIGREDELVAGRPARRVPRERRRARKRRRAVRKAGQERVERGRRLQGASGLRGGGRRGDAREGRRCPEREHGHDNGNEPNERHTSCVFGSYGPPGVPRRRDASRRPAARTSASSPVRPTSWTDAGRPSSAGPQGNASAGQPSALKGYVSRIIRSRRTASPIPTGGATEASVGVRSRSKPPSAASAVLRYSSRAREAAPASPSLTSRQRSTFVATFSP